MEPDEQDVVLAEDRAHDVEVEIVGRVRGRDRVAAERRRVQDHPPAVGQPVAPADRLARPCQPLLAEEDVRARDPEPPLEPLERLPEGLGVVRRRRLRGDQADVVVRVDPDPLGQLLVRPERLVEQAVADLLERPAGVPGLDDRRAAARVDDVDREEVVVHDEHARGGEVVARDQRLAEGRDPATQAPCRPACEDDHRDLRVARLQIVPDRHQVAGQRGRMGRREDDPRAERQETGVREGEPDGDDPDGEDEALHRARTSWSMTRSADPASRWAKCRAANCDTLSAS